MPIIGNGPQLFVPGPCYVFVGTALNGGMLLLGVCDGGINIQDQPFYEPVTSDLSGPYMPDDMVYLGMSSTMSGEFIKYDSAVLNAIGEEQVHPPVSITGLAGVYGGLYNDGNSFLSPQGEIGSLVNLENSFVRLTIVGAYFKKVNAFGNPLYPGMGCIRNYPKALFRSGFDSNWSARPKRIRWSAMAMPIIGCSGSFMVYNQDYTGIQLPCDSAPLAEGTIGIPEYINQPASPSPVPTNTSLPPRIPPSPGFSPGF